MRYLKALLLLLMLPSLASAQTAVLGPAANPPQPITILSQSAIPFIKASSGTMGNNCAISGLTALPRTYSNGAYIWLPANSIAAGVPASATWYWFVASSTTAGTCYNSTYTSGTPQRGTQTAFSTTGPGAFTGDTGTITSISIPLLAGSLGRNGALDAVFEVQATNNGNNKVWTFKLGAGAAPTHTMTTHIGEFVHAVITNRGIVNGQGIAYGFETQSGGVFGGAAADMSIDTSTLQTITFTLNSAVATDNQILENYRFAVYPRE